MASVSQRKRKKQQKRTETEQVKCKTKSYSVPTNQKGASDQEEVEERFYYIMNCRSLSCEVLPKLTFFIIIVLRVPKTTLRLQFTRKSHIGPSLILSVTTCQPE